jgi:hypothetical protein
MTEVGLIGATRKGKPIDVCREVRDIIGEKIGSLLEEIKQKLYLYKK